MLIFGMCEVVCMPFKTDISISYLSLAFKAVYSSKGLIFLVRTPVLGSLISGSDSVLLGEILCNSDFPPICGSPVPGCVS